MSTSRESNPDELLAEPTTNEPLAEPATNEPLAEPATAASCPTPRTPTLSSERARWMVTKSWANLTPEQRRQRMLPARLAAARRVLAQLDAQTPPPSDGGAS